jgi:hypothetical protein
MWRHLFFDIQTTIMIRKDLNERINPKFVKKYDDRSLRKNSGAYRH